MGWNRREVVRGVRVSGSARLGFLVFFSFSFFFLSVRELVEAEYERVVWQYCTLM